MFARRAGLISVDIATEKYILVIRGPTAKLRVPAWELVFPVSIIKKRTFMFKAFTAVNILGWGSLISTLKENFCGAMELRLTSNTGRNISQTDHLIKIVFIRLETSNIISTDGTMLIAVNVTNTRVRKVKYKLEDKFDLRP